MAFPIELPRPPVAGYAIKHRIVHVQNVVLVEAQLQIVRHVASAPVEAATNVQTIPRLVLDFVVTYIIQQTNKKTVTPEDYRAKKRLYLLTVDSVVGQDRDFIGRFRQLVSGFFGSGVP